MALGVLMVLLAFSESSSAWQGELESKEKIQVMGENCDGSPR